MAHTPTGTFAIQPKSDHGDRRPDLVRIGRARIGGAGPARLAPNPIWIDSTIRSNGTSAFSL